MTEPIAFARPFVLRRDRDVSDVSGVGIIADGIVFPDGHAAIHWRGKWPLTTPHPDGIDSIMAIHDHGGRGDLHIIWADHDEVRRNALADVVEAFDVPAEMCGTEAERAYLRREILRAIVRAWEMAHASHGEAERARADLTDAVMPIVGHVLEQRDRWRDTVGRAFALAYRWQGAHGSSMFLVRAAGAELRDELDGPEPTGDDLDDVRQHYLSPDMQPCTKHRGREERQRYGCNGPDPADQLPPNQGPLTGIEVRDPCPRCKDRRLIPRTLMDNHIREHHPDVTIASTDNGPDIRADKNGPDSANVQASAGIGVDSPADAGTLISECRDTDGCCPGGPSTCRLDAARASLREEYATVLTDAGVRIELGTAFGDRIVGAVLAVHYRAIAQLRQRLALAEATLSEYAEADSADAAAGSYAHRADQAEAALGRVGSIPRLPHRSQQTGELGRAYTRGWESVISAIDTAVGAVGSNDRQACPYCTGGPQFPRRELAAHVQEKHARVLAALAVGSLDEQLTDPETRCRLPHEMEA